jgi:hypothetical protein
MLASMRSRAAVLAVLSLLSMGGAGCGDSTAPLPAGHYGLQFVNEVPPPLPLNIVGDLETVLLGEELVLRGDGTGWRRTYTGRRPVGSAAVPAPDEVVPVELVYREVGGAFEIDRAEPCPPNALCVGPDLATPTANGLAVVSPRFAAGSDLRFQEIVVED